MIARLFLFLLLMSGADTAFASGTIPNPGSAIPVQQAFYGGAGGGTANISTVLNTVWGHVLAIVFAILGGVAVLMLFYGGIQYITSAGTDGAKKARQTVINAVMGIIVLTAAYGIIAILYGIANTIGGLL